MELCEFYGGKNALVLGGTGFIGSHLAQALASLGANVVAVGRDPWRLRDPRIGVWKTDLRNPSIKECPLSKCDFIFHLAASVGGIGYIKKREVSIFLDNIEMTRNALLLSKVLGAKAILFASSACVYPKDREGPLREGDVLPANPDSLYGWSKLFGEFLVRHYAEMNGMRYAIIRLFNTFGPRDNFDEEKGHVVPALIAKIAKSTGKVKVWGNGMQYRCFLYVDDAVDGMLRALVYACEEGSEVFNIAGERLTIRELIALLEEVSGKEFEVEYIPGPVGVSRVADCSKARSLLGWLPKIPIRVGLRKTYLSYIEGIGT